MVLPFYKSAILNIKSLLKYIQDYKIQKWNIPVTIFGIFRTTKSSYSTFYKIREKHPKYKICLKNHKKTAGIVFI